MTDYDLLVEQLESIQADLAAIAAALREKPTEGHTEASYSYMWVCPSPPSKTSVWRSERCCRARLYEETPVSEISARRVNRCNAQSRANERSLIFFHS
jgi:hypothetical protein